LTTINKEVCVEKQCFDLTITTINPMLGSQPGKDTSASDFIRDKAREEHPELQIPPDEVESLPSEVQKGTTCFYRTADGKRLAMRNYQIKGAIKDAAMVLNGLRGVKYLRSKIDNVLFVNPVELPIETTADPDKMEYVERPLRAMTMQGPRVSLARSEMIPTGAVVKCKITLYPVPSSQIDEAMLRELLDYSSQKGLLQWRNSGYYGQYEYELTECK
jgi:hypothetical protein